MFDVFMFDLDGTLTDPGEGITNCVMYALKKFGIEETDRTKLYKFIGPPLFNSFQEYYGFSEEECERAIVYYRERFRDKGIFENEVYENIPEVLMALKNAGKRIVLATSKAEEFSVRILKHFNIYEYFDFCAGATMDLKRNAKADVIKYALENIDAPDISRVIMIGDRKHDIIGAKDNGLKAIGVLYGYGDRDELENAGADYIIDRPENILEYI
ncbi:MAG: HAD family hydrolase [Lachnospiraceae bacterium]|nr:HAD family hydrolase [Lachnospiraceae bacterium]